MHLLCGQVAQGKYIQFWLLQEKLPYSSKMKQKIDVALQLLYKHKAEKQWHP